MYMLCKLDGLKNNNNHFSGSGTELGTEFVKNHMSERVKWFLD